MGMICVWIYWISLQRVSSRKMEYLDGQRFPILCYTAKNFCKCTFSQLLGSLHHSGRERGTSVLTARTCRGTSVQPYVAYGTSRDKRTTVCRLRAVAGQTQFLTRCRGTSVHDASLDGPSQDRQ